MISPALGLHKSYAFSFKIHVSEYSFIYDCWVLPAFCGAIEQHFVVHTEKFKKGKKLIA